MKINNSKTIFTILSLSLSLSLLIPFSAKAQETPKKEVTVRVPVEINPEQAQRLMDNILHTVSLSKEIQFKDDYANTPGGRGVEGENATPGGSILNKDSSYKGNMTNEVRPDPRPWGSSTDAQTFHTSTAAPGAGADILNKDKK